MKYLIFILLITLVSCTEPTTVLPITGTRIDTIYKIDTLIQSEINTVEVVKYITETECPIELAKELAKANKVISSLEDNVYNLQILNNKLLQYCPPHIQEAFKNKQ